MGWLSNFFGSKPVTHINEQAPPIDRAKAFAQLQENFNNHPDIFSSLLDRYYSNNEWWIPTGGTFPALGGTSNKIHGADRYAFYTEQDLRFQRDAARLLYAKEPVAKAIEGNLNAYVVGKGNTYKIVPKKQFKDQITEEQLQVWQEYLDEWLDAEQWAEREKECYTCKVVDGEFYLWVRVSGGRYSIRRIEPEHIQNPVGKTYIDGWYLGVKYDLKDAETPLAYGYKADYQPFQEIPASQIIHVKANVTKNVSRGISDFYAVMDDLNSIAGLADNMRAGATARAEIAFMYSIKDATPQAITRFAGTLKDAQSTEPTTGKTRYTKGMDAGKAVVKGSNVDYTTMPNGDSDGYVTIYQSAIRAIGARWSMPEYMISADASNNNYASIQVAGSPFDRYVQREQNTLKMHYKRLMRLVLEQAAVMMVIPTSVLPMIDIEIGCDSPVIVNRLEEAQVNEIEVRNGVLSPQQWCMANGRDYEDTQAQIEEWRDRNMEAVLQQQGIMPEEGGDEEDGSELGAFQESVGWDESKHKRASDGRFGNVAGAHGRRTDGKAHVVPGEALSTHIKANPQALVVEHPTQGGEEKNDSEQGNLKSKDGSNPKLPKETRPDLNDGEISQVKQYLADETEYYEVNEYLRDGGKLQGEAKTLQNAISKAEILKSPIIVTRGIEIDDVDTFLGSISDDVFTDKGFMSASTQGSFNGNVQMTIKARHGLDASFYGSNSGEMLLPANSDFKVTKIIRNKQKVQMEMEQIIYDN